MGELICLNSATKPKNWEIIKGNKMRDTVQTKEYFNKGIGFKQKTIDRDKGSVDELAFHSGRASRVYSLCERSVMLCTQMYSRGDGISDLKPSITQMMQMFKLRHDIMPTLELEKSVREMWQRLNHDVLYDIYSCLAFVVSLRYPLNEILSLLTWISHIGEDGLLDRIALQIGEQNRIVAPKAFINNAYDDLVAIIDTKPEEQSALLKKYVPKWYNRMKGTGTYNTHKGEAYVGYWCFEAALVAMLWDIDDSALVDNKYYPADLVKYYRDTKLLSNLSL